jgi:RNA polymerase sigma factor (sigma-70 family)
MNRSVIQILLGSRANTEAAGAGATTDAQLLERFVKSRDEAAFEVLVWRHGGMVYNLCRRVLRQADAAEDAFQATFLTLARKAHTVYKREALGSWLYKVAYRAALDARRAPPDPLPPKPPVTAGGDEAIWNEIREVLDEEINRLPEKLRAAFVLCCLDGLTNDEAARQLGCPKGTVDSRLARARERLRARLTRRGVGVPAAALAVAVAECGRAEVLPRLLAWKALAVARSAGADASVRVDALSGGVLRAMRLARLRLAVGVLLVVGLSGVAAVACGLFAEGRPFGTMEVGPPGQRQPDPGDPGPFVAQAVYQGIDPATVVAYERLGAIYGTMGTLTDLEFRIGRDQAEEGLPGFRFPFNPSSKLPEVAVPFGLDLSKSFRQPRPVTAAELKNLAGLKNLIALNLAGTPSEANAGLKDLAGLKYLTALRIQNVGGGAGLKDLAGLKNLTALRIEFTGFARDEVHGLVDRVSKMLPGCKISFK